MKKQLMIILLAAVGVMTACGSSGQNSSGTDNNTGTDSAVETESEILFGTEELDTEMGTEDAEPDNWMDYVPAVEETDEEQEYSAIGDSLDYEVLELETGLVIHAKNSEEPTDVQTDIGIQFYDASGNETWYGVAEFSSLPVGEDLYVPIWMEDTYSSYEVIIDTSKGYMEDITDGFSMETTEEGKNITASISNSGDKPAEIVSLTTLYYQGDQLVGCTIDYGYEVMNGEGASVEITQPENALTGKAVDYDSYKVILLAYAQDETETEDASGNILYDEAPASDQTLMNP